MDMYSSKFGERVSQLDGVGQRVDSCTQCIHEDQTMEREEQLLVVLIAVVFYLRTPVHQTRKQLLHFWICVEQSATTAKMEGNEESLFIPAWQLACHPHQSVTMEFHLPVKRRALVFY